MASIQAADGRSISYDLGGNGPPLLMLVGYGATRRGWAPQVDAFSLRFTVVTMDNRDAGESAPESEQYSIGDLADDAARLLDALGIERASVAGHSMGGFIALQFALNHPERVDRLILISTAAAGAAVDGRPVTLPEQSSWIEDPVERTRRRYTAMAAPGYFEGHPDQLEAVAATAVGNHLSFEGMRRQSIALQTTHDVRRQLGEISAPTLVIHGEADTTIPIRAANTLAGRIPNARLLSLPGIGHLPQWERPEEFNAAVLAFLDGPAE